MGCRDDTVMRNDFNTPMNARLYVPTTFCKTTYRKKITWISTTASCEKRSWYRPSFNLPTLLQNVILTDLLLQGYSLTELQLFHVVVARKIQRHWTLHIMDNLADQHDILQLAYQLMHIYTAFYIKTFKITPTCFDPKIIFRELCCSLLKSHFKIHSLIDFLKLI